MPDFPAIAPADRLLRLEPPTGPVEMVLDTDTDNELDDQFALTYALLSPDRLDLQAVYAAPYHNSRSTSPADGMHKSYDELVRVLERMGRSPEGLAFKGSETYLPAADQPVDSPAARNLVKRVMARPAGGPPLYVTAIGAITNVASAILMEPRIIERIVVVWLGGHAFNWHTAHEFNLKQDLHASRLLFDCGVPFVVVPCKNVAEHLRISRAEVNRYVKPSGKIGQYLHDVYDAQVPDNPGRTRVIWDMSTIAWLLDSGWVPSAIVASPVLTDQFTWSQDLRRHQIRCAYNVHRDAVFGDFFARLQAHAEREG